MTELQGYVGPCERHGLSGVPCDKDCTTHPVTLVRKRIWDLRGSQWGSEYERGEIDGLIEALRIMGYSDELP